MASMQETFPVDEGVIDFIQHRLPFKAEFIQVRPHVDKKLIVSHMSSKWLMGNAPGAVLRVCGSVANSNGEVLEEVFEGIAKAAQASSAWIFSTGLDFGVASVLGQALSRNRHKCSSPLIGVASWDSVQGRNQLLSDGKGAPAMPGDKRIYVDVMPDDNYSTVQLQSDHSHFILVGTREDKPEPEDGKSAEELLLTNRKRSFEFSHSLEAAIIEAQKQDGMDHSPRVLYVIAGDKTTLEEIITYLRNGNGLVLLAVPTGGLAAALGEFIDTGIVPEAWSGSKAEFEEIKRLNAAGSKAVGPKTTSASKALLDPSAQPTNHVIQTSNGAFMEEVCKSILDAVISQAETVDLRVRFAVAWDDEKLLQRELNSLPTWDVKQRSAVLRDALQQALELEAQESVRVCMANAAPIKEIDLLALYDKLYDDESPPKYRLFWGEAPTARRAKELTKPVGSAIEKSAPSREVMNKSQKSILSFRSASSATGGSNRKFREISLSTPHASKAAGGSNPIAARPAMLKRGSSNEELNRLLEEIVVPEVLVEDAVRDYYPEEVWKLLQGVVPGLTLYWNAKLTKLFRLGAHETGGMGSGDRPKMGARWLDVFVWAVFLGNHQLASMILPACQEPIRAAIIGARLCNHMADKIPLQHIELRACAAAHERFATSLLDLCESFDEARRMLITQSLHWNRTVLQLAVQSGLRDFCAHTMCQMLCNDMYKGNINAEKAQVVLSSAETPNLMSSVLLVFGALVGPKFAGICTGGPLIKWHIPPGEAIVAPDSEPPTYEYYRIPAVKQTLRMTMHVGFLCIVSLACIESKSPNFHPSSNVFDLTGGLRNYTMDGLIFLWNIALALDEWYKYARDKNSFSFDFWNKYDYTVITITFFAIAFRFFTMEVALDIVSFNVVLVWCRLFKYLSSDMEIGLLVIMIVNMMTDIYLWALVSMVFLGAFTVAFLSITDADSIDSESGSTPLNVPVWAMLGSFNVAEITHWNPHVGQPMLWLYVVVSNIILVNLLIAMMGHTFGSIKERADEEWKYGRLQSILEASERMSAIPPPFNLPITAIAFVKSEMLGYSLDSARVIDRVYLSNAKKAKQRIARKLLLKYKLQEEQKNEVKDEDSIRERIDYLVREIGDLKLSLSSQVFTGRGKGGEHKREKSRYGASLTP